MFRLDGRAALVTGAGSPSGIGIACARALLALGARVAIASTTDRIHDRASELGEGTVGFVADLTDEGAARALVADATAALGAIDVLVNNAGMVRTGLSRGVPARLVDLPAEEFELDLALNVMTAFHVTRAVLPGMLARGRGRIVNVSSVTGPLVTNPEMVGYSAAKAAMDGLTRAAAIEVAASGVTVNAVAPGWIATGSSTPEELAGAEHTPTKRAGTPAEVAAVVAFLASDEASYVTGQAVVVDGGNVIQEYKGPSERYY
ncbi:MAG: SDR family NAD(P)-dependent oxidoreductase [Actinomycetota bacterium]